MRKSATPQQVCDVLNDLTGLDMFAMQCLIRARVACNPQLEAHPAIQVFNPGGRCYPNVKIGLLGVLNALFGKYEDGTGCIVARTKDGKTVFEVHKP